MAAISKPSKKGKDHTPERIYFGRPTNSVSIGIVGMPNVGKSTLFNLLSQLSVPAENFPFCTIDPNKSRVIVPDKRFNAICAHDHPVKEVSAYLSVIDIAGLVKGASAGNGLGNAFLSNIKATDGIFHVVRAFKDEDIQHVEGEVNPIRDLQIIFEELTAKDLQICKNLNESLVRVVQSTTDKRKVEDYKTLLKVIDCLENNKDFYIQPWNNHELDYINTLQLLRTKSIIYLINIGQKEFLLKKNKWFGKINEWVEKNTPNSLIIPWSAPFEQYLLGLEPEEQKKYCEDNQVKSMVTKIIKSGYQALSLIHFFTHGPDEVKCWTIKRGTKAPQAAGIIHSDFEKGFICAEVMTYDDWSKYGSEQACKNAGKYRMQGREYEVQDGDIIFFKFNVGKSKK